jgi:hypothetical protein
MRDGLPFSSRVISDGTLRVLALLTLLHDPQRRGLICFEEPENGVHPGRVKLLMQRLRDMVTSPSEFSQEDVGSPLSQLLLNSHSPVVMSAMLDETLHVVDGTILFADMSSASDPVGNEVRRKTRLRPVRSRTQGELFNSIGVSPGFVSDLEVKQVLDSVITEG